MRCWAQALGGCGGGISREHYLSAAIVGTDAVVVSGLPFLKGAKKALPGERLVAKMLCREHNGATSDLDGEAGRFFKVVLTFKARAFAAGRSQSRNRPLETFQIDGGLLERWMLKTVINTTYRRHVGTGGPWTPPERWVKCVFGDEIFPERCGLYLLQGETDVFDSPEAKIGIRLVTRRVANSVLVIGGQFRLEQMQFALVMEPPHRRHAPDYRVREIHNLAGAGSEQVLVLNWGCGTAV